MTWDEFIEQERQQWLREYAEGKILGHAEGVLRVLAARGIAVDEKIRKFILACPDEEILHRWFDRALNATHLSDIW